MQHGFISNLSAITGKSKRILDAGYILFCVMILFSMAGCGTGKDKTETNIKSVGNTYSVKNLDFCTMSDKESCLLMSIDSAYNTLAVNVIIYSPPLAAITGREISLIYDMDGILRSQIDVRDAIGKDKVIVDQAIDASGNLKVLARAQGNDNAVHNYLYSFDAAGKLAGDPLDLKFVESFSPMNFVIGANGCLYFGSYYIHSITPLSRKIYVLDSEGTPFFGISYEWLLGPLYQVGDVILTDSNKGGSDSGNSAQLLPIDTSNRKLGDPIDISKVTSSGGVICAGSDGFYLINTVGIYSINLETQNTKEILLWKDTDTNLTAFKNDLPAVMISNDKLFLLSSIPAKTGGAASITVSLLTREE